MSADRVIPYAARYSRYLQRLLAARPDVISTAEAGQSFTAADMQAELPDAAITDDASLGRALRRLRQRVMARLIVRDLGGYANLDEVVGSVTQLAEIAIRTAVTRLHGELASAHGEPRGASSGAVQRLHVFGREAVS